MLKYPAYRYLTIENCFLLFTPLSFTRNNIFLTRNISRKLKQICIMLHRKIFIRLLYLHSQMSIGDVSIIMNFGVINKSLFLTRQINNYKLCLSNFVHIAVHAKQSFYIGVIIISQFIFYRHCNRIRLISYKISSKSFMKIFG